MIIFTQKISWVKKIGGKKFSSKKCFVAYLLNMEIFVQRLRSKPWTYKSKFLFFFLSVFHSVSNFQGDAARRREASYDVARLLLMAPIDPWRNSTPDFGAVAFCTTNIEDFRTSLTSTFSSISSTYSSQRRS